MGSIRKQGQSYRAEVCINRVRKSKTLRTKREAQQWINEIEGSYHRLTSGKSRIKDLADRYIEEVISKQKGSKQAELRLLKLVDELPDIPIDELEPRHFNEWKQEKLKTVSNATVRRYLGVLSGFFSHAYSEWQVIPKNPLNGLKKPPNSPPRNRYPSDEEVKLLLSVLDSGKHKIQVGITLQIALETAMRAGEILSLNDTNIDYKRRVASLSNTKNGDSREVPLSSKAIELLKSVRPHYFTVSSAVHSRLFHDAVLSCGIIDLRFHDSRAAGLMRLSKKVDVLTLARIAGMRSPATLMIYYRPNASDIAKLLD